MATEKFENNAASTLNGAINNSVTTLVITSATGFPTTGQFRILIGSEIMLVTAVSGTTYTVTRGAESTTAVSHANGDAITHVVTKGAFNQIISDNSQRVAFGSLPASEKAGRVVKFTDSNYEAFDNGSSWQYYGPRFNFTAPDNSQFSWGNQGSATVSTANGHIYLAVPSAGGDNLRLRYKSAPGTPYTVTTYIHYSGRMADYAGGGIAFYESGSGKILFFVMGMSTSNRIGHGTLTSWFTDSSTNFGTGVASFLRMQDDGTNLKFHVSPDGFNFHEVYTQARTTNFTSAPDKIGHVIHNAGSSFEDAGIALYSWLEA